VLALLFGAIGIGVFWAVIEPRIVGAASGFGALGTAYDLYTYFLPKFVFGTEELVAGRLPLWNPYEFAGIPFLATAQPATLYAPKIAAFALFDPHTAAVVFSAAHHLLALGGTVLFLTGEGTSTAGLVAGASYFTFAGLLGYYNPATFASYAWTPLVFAAGGAVARRPGARAIGVLALVVAMQFTAGYPEFVLDTALLLAVYATVLRWTGGAPNPPSRTIPRLAIGVALGLMAAGLQAVPLADLVLAVDRAALASASLARAATIDLGPWITFVVLFSMVISFPSLAALGWGALGRRAAVAPAVAFGIAAFVAVVGLRWLRALPGFGFIRLPVVWGALTQFFVAWLVALGTDALVRRPIDDRGARWGRVLVGICGLGGAARSALAAFSGVSSAALGIASVAGIGGGLLMAGLALVVAGRRAAAAAAIGTVALIVGGELAATLAGPTLPPLALAESPSRASALLGRPLGPGDGRVLSFPDLSSGHQLRERVEQVFGFEGSLEPPRFGALDRRLGVDIGHGRIDWRALAAAKGLLDALDVHFVVAPRGASRFLTQSGLVLERLGAQGQDLYRNREPGGRAWVVYGAVVAESPAAALDRVLAPDFDPRRTVVLERPPAGSYPAAAVRPPTPARVEGHGPTRLDVVATLPVPGLLVLSESCFPGWRASVDGRPADILCANYLTRAVELPAGLHVVRFTYRPWSVPVGAAASCVGLALIGVLFARRRSRGPDAGATVPAP
jgi:hypothetical protein